MENRQRETDDQRTANKARFGVTENVPPAAGEAALTRSEKLEKHLAASRERLAARKAGEAAHTPGPWYIPVRIGDEAVKIYMEGHRMGSRIQVAELGHGSEAVANAAFIVRACNSHAALVSRLSDTLALYAATRNPDADAIADARAALKSATS